MSELFAEFGLHDFGEDSPEELSSFNSTSFGCITIASKGVVISPLSRHGSTHHVVDGTPSDVYTGSTGTIARRSVTSLRSPTVKLPDVKVPLASPVSGTQTLHRIDRETTRPSHGTSGATVWLAQSDGATISHALTVPSSMQSTAGLNETAINSTGSLWVALQSVVSIATGRVCHHVAAIHNFVLYSVVANLNVVSAYC
jgi:hypothetical protein